MLTIKEAEAIKQQTINHKDHINLIEHKFIMEDCLKVIDDYLDLKDEYEEILAHFGDLSRHVNE